MDKLLQSSEITVSVRFDREVYAGKDVTKPGIVADVSMERTYWIDGGNGTDGQVDYTSLSWMIDSQGYMLTTNSEDIATFEDYEEAEEEIIDRLTSQFRKRLKDAIHID